MVVCLTRNAKGLPKPESIKKEEVPVEDKTTGTNICGQCHRPSYQFVTCQRCRDAINAGKKRRAESKAGGK